MSFIDLTVVAANLVLVASALSAGVVWMWAALTIQRHARSELRALSGRLDRLAGELREIVRHHDADEAAALADALDDPPGLGPIDAGPPH
jgi:hypothetical protein